MRFILLIGLSLFVSSTHAQVLCGTANENGTLTLTAPAGYQFTSIEFASYGTPTGTCATYATSSCHAVNSASIVAAVFVGQNSASIGATNGVFGDPCVGTVKRLYVRARYDAALPLTLSALRYKMVHNELRLQWITAGENNTSHFVIEKSEDGSHFSKMDSVASKGYGGHVYEYTKKNNLWPSQFYCRLRMVDKDGRYEFSKTIKITVDEPSKAMYVTYNPQDHQVNIYAQHAAEATLYNGHGQLLRKMILKQGYQLLNVQHLSPGVYIIRSAAGTVKFIRR